MKHYSKYKIVCDINVCKMNNKYHVWCTSLNITYILPFTRYLIDILVKWIIRLLFKYWMHYLPDLAFETPILNLIIYVQMISLCLFDPIDRISFEIRAKLNNAPSPNSKKKNQILITHIFIIYCFYFYDVLKSFIL